MSLGLVVHVRHPEFDCGDCWTKCSRPRNGFRMDACGLGKKRDRRTVLHGASRVPLWKVRHKTNYCAKRFMRYGLLIVRTVSVFGSNTTRRKLQVRLASKNFAAWCGTPA